MAALLSPAEVSAALSRLPDWEPEGDGRAIRRTFTFGNFVEAVDFVNRITEVAEEMDHHPDVDIRWNKVTLRLSTHRRGGLTKADFDLAARLQAVD